MDRQATISSVTSECSHNQSQYRPANPQENHSPAKSRTPQFPSSDTPIQGERPDLTGLCKSDALLQELSALPDPDSFKSVPDYFDGYELSLDKLPPHLKGLNIKLEESHLRKEEVNLLIQVIH